MSKTVCLGVFFWAITFVHADIGSAANYHGRIVSEIHIEGLNRTDEESLRGILGTKPGAAFDSEEWTRGIARLQSTESFYDVSTRFETAAEKVKIILSVRERWTLIPRIQVRSGGGQSIIGVGLQELNLFGRLTEASFLFAYQNGALFYDFYIEHEYIGTTPYRAAFYFQKSYEAQTLKDAAGTILDTFAYTKYDASALVGKRLARNWQITLENRWRTDGFAVAPTSGLPTLYTGTQWQMKLQGMRGRTVLVDDQEKGSRLVVGPELIVAAGNSNPVMATFVIDWKEILPLWPTGPEANESDMLFAYRLAAKIATDGPFLYWPYLGGYESVRGFTASRAIGREMIRANFEFRQRLFRMTLPLVGNASVQGVAFTDMGAVRSHLGSTPLGLWSLGAGLRFSFYNFARSLLRLDFAQTLSPSEGYDVSFGIGFYF